ncbi:hypothetical protein [Candidatus Entotheonella palauensis]|uniref:Uncharacterized protein n=1 Tax=Candidatus Entotheonella gemina TaxID=1429439 RepID=W4LT89_9BACT|nr:hypothetical protein [Candidatus Entotheonella palauensis]ETX01193.1 MAG: hypothetical protein ETSY2_37700 [Candidatus Entotheonella gemina]
MADTFSLSLAQVWAAVDYIDEHRDDLMEVHRRIEERNARGHSSEIREKLETGHFRHKAWMNRRQAEADEHDGAGHFAGY